MSKPAAPAAERSPAAPGHPRFAPAPGDPPFCVRIPQADGLALRARCGEEGVSVAQFLRDCLRASLDRRLQIEPAPPGAPPDEAAPLTPSTPVCTRLSPRERSTLRLQEAVTPGRTADLVRACVRAYLTGRLHLLPATAPEPVRPSYFVD